MKRLTAILATTLLVAVHSMIAANQLLFDMSDQSIKSDEATTLTCDHHKEKTTVFIVYYSTYGHVRRLAEEIKKGVELVPHVEAKIFRVRDVNSQQSGSTADESDGHAFIDADQLKHADGILFGLSTRFGAAPAQMKLFMDETGKLWVERALVGKTAGTFFSTSSQGGGQETTALTFLTHFVHHGMIYVPLGYPNDLLENMDEVHGGSPYGTGTIAGGDNSRKPTELELTVARTQGENFAKTTKALKVGKKLLSNSAR